MVNSAGSEDVALLDEMGMGMCFAAERGDAGLIDGLLKRGALVNWANQSCLSSSVKGALLWARHVRIKCE